MIKSQQKRDINNIQVIDYGQFLTDEDFGKHAKNDHHIGITVSWCFKPSEPQRIISGLRETFIKINIVERTNKAGIRPEEQSEKAESCQETLWNEIQLRWP